MFDPHSLKGKADRGRKILKNKFVGAILAYVVFILILYAFRGSRHINTIGYYSIFFPLWLFMIVLIVLSYLIFWRIVKFIVYGSLVVGLLFLLFGHKLFSLAAFGPAAIIILLFIMFFLGFILSILGAGLIVAIFFALIFGHMTHSTELAGIAAFFGFALGVSLTYLIYTKIVLPFSFGFSLSLIAANIASTLASMLFFLSGAFSLPSVNYILGYASSRYSYYYYGGSLKFLNLFSFFVEYFKFLAEKQLVILIGSVIVGILTIIAVNIESIEKTETKQWKTTD